MMPCFRFSRHTRYDMSQQSAHVTTGCRHTHNRMPITSRRFFIFFAIDVVAAIDAVPYQARNVTVVVTPY